MKKPRINQIALCAIAIVSSLMLCTQKCCALSPPTISPNTGISLGNTSVTITAPAGTIYFTTDGSNPTTNSQVYSSALTIDNTTVLKAIAVQAGVSSSVTTTVLTFDPSTQCLMNGNGFLWLRSDVGVTSNSGGVSNWQNSFSSGYSFTASQVTSSKQPLLVMNALNGHPAIQTGSNKYFNLSGFSYDLPLLSFYCVTKPNGSSNGNLIGFSGNSTGESVISSSVSAPSATFTIWQGASGPPASITATSAVSVGQYSELEMKTLSSTNSAIYTNGFLDVSGSLGAPSSSVYNYFWNTIGTDYTTSSNFYDGSFCELLLFVNLGSQVDPYLLSRYQIFTQNPQVPIISVPGGALSGPTQVAISVPADTICKFTLTGSTPTTASPTYTGPINIYYSQTLKTIGIKNGYASSVASASYTLDSTQYPAPNSLDSSSLQVNVQSPN